MNQAIYMASLRRWLTHPGIVIGVVILSLVVAVAVAAPWLYTIDPNAMDPSNSLQAPGVRAEFITLGGESFNRLFLMGTDGVAVFPSDDTYTPLWREMAGSLRTLTFSDTDRSADVHALAARWEGQGWFVHLHTPAGDAGVRLNIAGRHNVRNALAATACALAAGVGLPAVVQGLQDFEPVGGRSRTVGLVDAPGQRFVFSLFDTGEIWVADFSQGNTPEITRYPGIGQQPYDALITADGRYYMAGLFGEDGMAQLDLWHPERGVVRVRPLNRYVVL